MSDTKQRTYDDIVEDDNRLPTWWLVVLFGTMLFGFGYWFVFHTLHAVPSPLEEYQAEREAQQRARVAANPMSDEALLALVAAPDAVEAGHQVFVSTCAACHGQQAEGLVGPNLTDAFWIHGNTPTDIATAVNAGFVDKGMPPWGPVLGDDKVRKVTAYVLSLKGKNVPGRPPQGERIE
ncbi:MAG: c-type cytochrome [Archangium sp.]|nr:c-type cytochrome [Archangium sp.]